MGNLDAHETVGIWHRTQTNKTKNTAHKTKQVLHLDFGTVSTVWYSSFIILFIVQSLKKVVRWESKDVNRRTDN